MNGNLLLTHAFVTWYMTGVIWLVQLGQYPLFAHTGKEAFPGYYRKYVKAISFVVVGPMIAELVTGVLLLVNLSGTEKFTAACAGFVLILLIWLSTAFLQVPQHRILEKGFGETACRRLVSGNWIRTLLWTLRALLIFYLI